MNGIGIVVTARDLTSLDRQSDAATDQLAPNRPAAGAAGLRPPDKPPIRS